MIKGVFVLKKIDKEKIKKIKQLGFNSVFVNYKNLNEHAIKSLKEKNFKIFAEIGIFTDNLCPNDEIVRQNKLGETRNIIKIFQIDGIWLDFIRFPLLWEVKNPQIRKVHICSKCQHIKNKSKIINSFVSQVCTLINQSGKNIKLGMFSVPWEEKDFGGAITKIIGQDFKSLARFIDVFSPMVYHKMCGRKTTWIHKIVSYMDRVTDKPILPIIQTEDKPKKISKKEFREEIEEAIKKPSLGVIVFFLEDLLKDKNKVQVLSVK